MPCHVFRRVGPRPSLTAEGRTPAHFEYARPGESSIGHYECADAEDQNSGIDIRNQACILGLNVAHLAVKLADEAKFANFREAILELQQQKGKPCLFNRYFWQLGGQMRAFSLATYPT